MAAEKKAPRRAKPRGPTALNDAVYGIGVDVLRLERMQKVYTRHGERLAQKILCAAELREWRARGKRQPARFLAKAFAVKEALVKALGTGFSGVDYRDGGLIRAASGQPQLVVSRKLRTLLKQRGVGSGHVSLSDDGDIVCAFVVLEKAHRLGSFLA